MADNNEWVTLTRTGFRPVRFRDRDWALVADARGDNYGDGLPDDAKKAQEWAAGHYSVFRILVRRHRDDGRWLVYGFRLSVSDEWRGADVLAADWDIADAVTRFGAAMGAPARVVQAALDELPPLDLSADSDR
jgi:hypothetical protein